MSELQERVESKIKKYFGIGYFDTEGNRSIVKTFKKFCELEADNNYLLGIKILLQSYSTDWKYESLQEQINNLKLELHKSGSNSEEKNKKQLKTFGVIKNE